MIVNPDYKYMRKSVEPANPVIFSGKSYNYEYAANNVSENVNGFLFESVSDITFLNMNLTEFSSIAVTAFHRSSLAQSLRISALKSDGSESPTSTLSFPRNQTSTQSWTIPESFRIKNAKIKLQAVNNTSAITAQSAIMS